jgi:hypothetical protein
MTGSGSTAAAREVRLFPDGSFVELQNVEDDQHRRLRRGDTSRRPRGAEYRERDGVIAE